MGDAERAHNLAGYSPIEIRRRRATLERDRQHLLAQLEAEAAQRPVAPCVVPVRKPIRWFFDLSHEGTY